MKPLDGPVSEMKSMFTNLMQYGGSPFARQLGIFISCYLGPPEQTVRGLAADLQVLKPAVSKALDSLCDLGLLRRVPDPRDRRSMLVRRTGVGVAFFGDVKALLATGMIEVEARRPTSDSGSSPIISDANGTIVGKQVSSKINLADPDR
ncbi:MAG: MarR family transcriptional regulator [Acetobacteraceae bacterium]